MPERRLWGGEGGKTAAWCLVITAGIVEFFLWPWKVPFLGAAGTAFQSCMLLQLCISIASNSLGVRMDILTWA